MESLPDLARGDVHVPNEVTSSRACATVPQKHSTFIHLQVGKIPGCFRLFNKRTCVRKEHLFWWNRVTDKIRWGGDHPE